jgi:hypothetical protein
MYRIIQFIRLATRSCMFSGPKSSSESVGNHVLLNVISFILALCEDLHFAGSKQTKKKKKKSASVHIKDHPILFKLSGI